jgi:hypothetical protein
MNRTFTFVVYIRDSAQTGWTAWDGAGFGNAQDSVDLQGFNAAWQRFPHRDKGATPAVFCGIACATLAQCGWQPAIN